MTQVLSVALSVAAVFLLVRLLSTPLRWFWKLCINTLCGAELQATGNWRGNLPFTLAKRADFAAQSALAQPVDFREFYRYDAKKNTVEIRNICRFREFGENDWKRTPRKMLFLPPVLSLMADRGFDAVLPKNLRDLNYPTIYGPLYGVEGSEITYTLPVPDVPQYSIARNTEGNAADVACLRQHAMDNVEGAKFRLFDERICRAWQTVNLPGCEVSKVWHYYPAEYQAYLKGLFRYLMEISSGYRANRFWRSLVEPYSGKKYFYSFSIGAEYPGDVGVFGDRGYGVGLHLLQLDLWSSLTGDNDRFAAYGGISAKKLMLWSMVLSGAICGLTGMLEVFGLHKRFMTTLSNEFYFDGMLVAMIMRYQPFGVILMSLFFAVLNIGSRSMELSAGISSEVILIVQSIIIFFMAAEGGIRTALQDRSAIRKARREAAAKEAGV